jgi:hypothetical protein
MAARKISDFTLDDPRYSDDTDELVRVPANGVPGPARVAVAPALQHGQGRGASLSNPSIRVRSSH